MASLAQDFRYAFRQLRLSPVYTLTTLLTLALAIGSATAVFSLVYSVLLQPFGFKDPNQLVIWRETIKEVSDRYPMLPDNYRHFLYLKAHSSTIRDAALIDNTSFAVSVANGHPQLMNGLSVSTNFFNLLGIEPMLGRTFSPEESQQGRNDAVIISWAVWRELFNSNPNAIGRSLRVDGTEKKVIGVLPNSFPPLNEIPGAANPDQSPAYGIFQPFVPQSDELTSDDADFAFLVIGRLKPGVSVARATSELNGMQEAYSVNNHLKIHLGAVVLPLAQEVTGNVRRALWILLGAISGVLLIACVNLASLQLARSVSRDGDTALRIALGAGSHQLLRSLFVESFVLTACGGIAGVLLAFGGVRLLVALAPSDLPRLNEVHLSSSALLFALCITIVTALIFGILPGLRLLRIDPQQMLKNWSARVSSAGGILSTRSLLVTFEIACTVVLLVFTVLMLRSLSHLLNQPRAFNADQVVVAQANLLGPRYNSGQDNGALARSEFVDRAIERLRTNPGVRSVAVTSSMLLTGENALYSIFRKDNPVPESKAPIANLRNISTAYFSALQIPLVSGAPFGSDEKQHPIHAIISRSAAKAAWPGENPLGRTFKINGREYTVSGVSADARIIDLKSNASVVYLPYWHDPPSTVFFLVRTSQPSQSLATAVRRELWDLDPQIALPTIRTVDSQVMQSVAPERFRTVLLSSFGLAALGLSLLGIYGVVAYSVSLKMREFGIRLALGSRKSTLVGLVLAQGSYPILGGLVLGLLGAAAAIRTIRSLLYGTTNIDPWSVGISTGILLGCALIACLLPAFRAMNVDVVKTLHQN